MWGGSYGTYAVQRYLHLFPDQPDGVVLEGIQHPARDFVGYDADLDRVSRDVFALCAADPGCADHFAGDPWAKAEDVVDRLDQGHCPTLGMSSDAARAVLGSLVFYWPLRDLMPAVVHRLDRCDDEDVQALVTLWWTLGGVMGASGNTGGGASNLLFFHVALSEMWHAPDEAPTVDEATEAWRTLTASTGLETWLAARLPEWPRYPADAFDDQVPAYEGPLLMLQGGLDAPTPWDQAEALRQVFDGPAQTWALFPYGAHGIVGTSPTASGDCALDVYLQFLDDPSAPPDLSCVGEVAPPDFDGDPAVNTWLLGTSDAWGGRAASSVAPMPPPPAAFRLRQW